MKNWADHCSSDDDEDFAERIEQIGDDVEHDEPVHNDDSLDLCPNVENFHLYQDEDNEASTINHEDGNQHGKEKVYEEQISRDYVFPSEPPFTAFVGNLAYTIKDANTLAEKMIELVGEKLRFDLHIVEAKIIKNPNTDRHRGFGYIQVETLDMLKELMHLNDMEATLAGRRLQLNTANQLNNNHVRKSRVNNKIDDELRRSRSSNMQQPYSDQNSKTSGNTDGTKFRGGRFSNKVVTKTSSEPAAPQQSPAAFDDGSLAQRIPLNLKPRTKPVQLANVSRNAGEKGLLEASVMNHTSMTGSVTVKGMVDLKKRNIGTSDNNSSLTEAEAEPLIRNNGNEGNQNTGGGGERDQFRVEGRHRANAAVSIGKLRSRNGGGNDHRRTVNPKSTGGGNEEPMAKHRFGHNSKNDGSSRESGFRGSEGRFRNGGRATNEGNRGGVSTIDRHNYNNRISTRNGGAKNWDRSLGRANAEKQHKPENESQVLSLVTDSAVGKKKTYSNNNEQSKPDDTKKIMNSFAALESDSDSN